MQLSGETQGPLAIFEILYFLKRKHLWQEWQFMIDKT